MSDDDEGIEAPPPPPKDLPESHPNVYNTNMNLDTGLTQDQVERARQKWGWNEIETPSTSLYVLFLRQFTGFMSIIILIAAVVAAAVEDWSDMGVILIMLLVNASLGFHEEYKCAKSLAELGSSLESEIAIRRNGKTQSLLTKECVPGDVVLLVGGTILPADVQWKQGDTMRLDTAALTGEPIPRQYPGEHGDILLSGTTVVAGECYGIVVATGVHTEIGQAQANVMADKSKATISVFEQKILHMVKLFVSASFLLVVAVLLVKGFAYEGFFPEGDLADKVPGSYLPQGVADTVLGALSILIASIPIALPLVLQVNLALGAGFLAREHSAIVTSTPALQDIASMSMLCSDKTGTLTTAKMSVISEKCVVPPNSEYKADDVLLYASLCSNQDKKDDPIDKAVLEAYQKSGIAQREHSLEQTEIIGFNPVCKRVVAFVRDKRTGTTWTIAKGLPTKILDTSAGGIDDHECQWKVQGAEDPKFVQGLVQQDTALSKAGYKTIAIALCEGDCRSQAKPVWKFVGLLPMLDPPREDTPATIASLHYANISVKMITGDHVNVGKETCRLIGLGTDLHAGQDIRTASNPELRKQMILKADGFGAVLPSDKREVVLTLKNEFGLVTGMTGDGVNDAPALSAAQVGIAVEGATDAARNAADLILTKPGLQPIYGAVLESRRIFARIKAYVVYRMAASAILVLVLSTVSFAGEGCVVDSILIIALALLNDLSMLPVAYDRADATAKPQLPNTTKLILTSLYFGVFHTLLTLAFLFGIGESAEDPNRPITSAINFEECANDSTGPTAAFLWVHLTIATELVIFSVRAPSFFFFSMPSPWLIVSVLVTCIIVSLVGVYALDLSGWSLLWIWVFNIAAFVVVDAGKILFRRSIHDAPGAIIATDELVPVLDSKTEVQQNLEKQERYKVHKQSVMDPSDMERPSIQVGGFFHFRNRSNGIVSKQPGARLHHIHKPFHPFRKHADTKHWR